MASLQGMVRLRKSKHTRYVLALAQRLGKSLLAIAVRLLRLLRLHVQPEEVVRELEIARVLGRG